MKVLHFNKKITDLLSKGMPSFWDDKGNIISNEDYEVLLVQNKSEEDKFEDLDKHMKGPIIVEKLNEDFDLLAEIWLIQKNLQNPSYTQSVEIEVIKREM